MKRRKAVEANGQVPEAKGKVIDRANTSTGEEHQVAAEKTADSNGEEGPAVAEDLQAEVHRHTQVLDELFPRQKHGGRAHGRDRGHVGGRGLFGVQGGLLVSRFEPAASAPVGDIDDPKMVTEPPQGKSGKKRKKDHGEGIAVAPTFAYVFKGGPRRKEADLPEREEDRRELHLPPQEDQCNDNAGDWLTSLVGSADEQARGDTSKSVGRVGAVDWLTTLKSTADISVGAAAGTAREQSPTLAAYMGQPLPIPPFWRTASEEDLTEKLSNERSALWNWMKANKKKALKTEKKRGSRRPRRLQPR